MGDRETAAGIRVERAVVWARLVAVYRNVGNGWSGKDQGICDYASNIRNPQVLMLGRYCLYHRILGEK